MTPDDLEVPLLRRIGALFIDWLIALGIAGGITATPIYGDNQVSGWIPLLVYFVMASLLNGMLGFTIGKRLMKIRLINQYGHPIGILKAMLRTALLCLVIPGVIMTEDKRGLHDLAAGSKVVPIG